VSLRVIAYHVILTCYGFWLPNDERGSGSTSVRAAHLRPFGPATADRADGIRSVAHRRFDRHKARLARDALKLPCVRLSGVQAKIVAIAMGQQLDRDRTTCFGFAIMPDHLHCVLGRSDRRIEQMMTRLKAAATHALIERDLHPLSNFARRGVPPKLFARGGRKRFLFTDAEVRSRIRYVEQNPIKSGLKPQFWSFVRQYPA
jgi:REP element-mobilizing transposase RayT